MRAKHTAQQSIFLFQPDHEISDVLTAISAWFDSRPDLLEPIARDLDTGKSKDLGRPGMSCEQVLRCALLLVYRQLSYDELAFCLRDSLSFQHFARVDPLRVPARSTLQGNIARITATTWEMLHRCLTAFLIENGFESPDRIRMDSTVTQTHILSPTDSRLLYDAMVLSHRHLKLVKQHCSIRYVNHTRRGRRHYLAAHSAKHPAQREKHYEMLIRDVGEMRDTLAATRQGLENKGFERWCREADELITNINRVLDQSTRRVFHDETVPAEEKIVSLHEPHTDIIKKGGRDTFYGHKINLVTGAAGIVLDVSIEKGNPADNIRFIPLLDRHIKLFGEPPKEVAADGGYANEENLAAANERGIDIVAFHKKKHLTIDNMTGGDPWLYRELRNFRAGIEASISYLKRCFGLSRIRRHGRARFDAYIWLAVLTHNLVRWARSG